MRMSRMSASRVFRLGDLAPARGTLDPLNLEAHEDKITRGAELIGHPASYTPYGHDGVICVDDRLSGAAGLAGGALSLAFMHNYLFGGTLLSHSLHQLQAIGTRLSFHDNCGALELATSGLIQRHLTDVRADGYKIVEGLGYGVPMRIRRNIAAWSRDLPVDFVDHDESMAAAEEVLGVSGTHLAGFVGVSLVSGYGFTAHDELKRETDMLAFRFDPTVAFREARLVTDEHARASEAAYLALVFTAEVLLELTGPELIVGVYS
jgi:hypothetical protein